MEALLLTPLIPLAYLLWRSDRRYDAAQALLTATLDEWTADRKALLEHHEDGRKQERASHEAERREWVKERSQLLNRVQRPDQAVYENFEPSSTRQHVEFDNDEMFWEAYNLPKVNDGDQ